MAVGNAQQTSIDSYNIIYEGGDATAPTAFPIGVTSGAMDLLNSNNGGKGLETKANYLELIISGDKAGSGDILITAAAEGGPEEAVALLECTFGTVVETAPYVWADTIDLTSYSLAACSTLVADSGNSRVAKFGTDAIGKRYWNIYPTLTTTTNIRVYARFF
jgi:hypothetical protein